MSQRENCNWLYSILALVATAIVGLTFIAGQVAAEPTAPEVPQSSGWIHQDNVGFGNRIDMVSADDGWMVLRGSHVNSLDEKAVYLYHWNGVQWTPEGSIVHTERVFHTDISMVSETDGWIVVGSRSTNSLIYHWNGLDWTKHAEVQDANGVSLLAIDMVSSVDGWALGEANAGSVYYHWDGTSWQQADQSAMPNVDGDIDMLSGSDGWAIAIGITRWNGSDWVDVSSPVDRTLRSISMLSTNDGWIVGGGYYEPGVILHWDGNAWSEILSPVNTGLLSVDMVSAEDGWAVGLEGAVLHWDGVSWTQVPHPWAGPIYAIDMLSSTDGWFTGLAGGTYRFVVLPEMAINVTNGAPGSYFTITGSDYPTNEEATVHINGHEVGMVMTDANGAFTLLLSTADADEGIYLVTVGGNPGTGAQFVLTATAPVRPKVGEGTVISVPAGIAVTEQLFLPTIVR